MNRQIILSFPLDEFTALQRDAEASLRPVKDHARYIIRQALAGAALPAEVRSEPVTAQRVHVPTGRSEPLHSP